MHKPTLKSNNFRNEIDSEIKQYMNILYEEQTISENGLRLIHHNCDLILNASLKRLKIRDNEYQRVSDTMRFIYHKYTEKLVLDINSQKNEFLDSTFISETYINRLNSYQVEELCDLYFKKENSSPDEELINQVNLVGNICEIKYHIYD